MITISVKVKKERQIGDQTISTEKSIMISTETPKITEVELNHKIKNLFEQIEKSNKE